MINLMIKTFCPNRSSYLALTFISSWKMIYIKERDIKNNMC